MDSQCIETCRPEDTTRFGYESPPDTPALTREVLKWAQSLDLSQSVKNVRRDAANGFIVAEILSRYFPSEVQMHSISTSVSSKETKENWRLIKLICDKQGIELPSDLIEGTRTGVHGAAVALLERMYELFTGKKLQRMIVVTADVGLNDLKPGHGASSGADGGRVIASQLKSSTNIEFGQVQIATVDKANELRKTMRAS